MTYRYEIQIVNECTETSRAKHKVWKIYQKSPDSKSDTSPKKKQKVDSSNDPSDYKILTFDDEKKRKATLLMKVLSCEDADAILVFQISFSNKLNIYRTYYSFPWAIGKEPQSSFKLKIDREKKSMSLNDMDGSSSEPPSPNCTSSSSGPSKREEPKEGRSTEKVHLRIMELRDGKLVEITSLADQLLFQPVIKKTAQEDNRKKRKNTWMVSDSITLNSEGKAIFTPVPEYQLSPSPPPSPLATLSTNTTDASATSSSSSSSSSSSTLHQTDDGSVPRRRINKRKREHKAETGGVRNNNNHLRVIGSSGPTREGPIQNCVKIEEFCNALDRIKQLEKENAELRAHQANCLQNHIIRQHSRLVSSQHTTQNCARHPVYLNGGMQDEHVWMGLSGSGCVMPSQQKGGMMKVEMDKFGNDSVLGDPMIGSCMDVDEDTSYVQIEGDDLNTPLSDYFSSSLS